MHNSTCSDNPHTINAYFMKWYWINKCGPSIAPCRTLFLWRILKWSASKCIRFLRKTCGGNFFMQDVTNFTVLLTTFKIAKSEVCKTKIKLRNQKNCHKHKKYPTWKPPCFLSLLKIPVTDTLNFLLLPYKSVWLFYNIKSVWFCIPNQSSRSNIQEF